MRSIKNRLLLKGRKNKKTIITILFVLDGDLLHPRQVRLGECNYDYIEVISGLAPGEQVIVSDMTKYKGKEK